MASPIQPLASSSAGASAAGAQSTGKESGDGIQNIASTDTFLKLLVAQIRYQDPLNPADGTQFVSQLAQFSELEQVVGVREHIRAIREILNSAALLTAAPPGGTPAPAAPDDPAAPST